MSIRLLQMTFYILKNVGGDQESSNDVIVFDFAFPAILISLWSFFPFHQKLSLVSGSLNIRKIYYSTNVVSE